MVTVLTKIDIPKIILVGILLLTTHLCFSCAIAPNQECNTAIPIQDNLMTNCVTGCTEGASPGVLVSGTMGCGLMPFPTVWYSYTTGTDFMLLDIEINSTELEGVTIALYSGNCGSLVAESCSRGVDGWSAMAGQDLIPSTNYYIAVSTNDGSFGEFEMCTTLQIDPSLCNTNSSIVVKNTSLGSPFSGPYKANENVEFCFEINAYQNSNCNYLHTIAPDFGDGWAASSFDANGQPNNMTKNLTTNGVIDFLPSQFQPVCEGDPTGDWMWFADGIVTYNLNSSNTLGLGAGDPVGGCWSFLNSFDPDCFMWTDACCTNPTNDPNLSFGDNNYPACYVDQTWVWEVCFELTTVGSPDCNSLNDCTVSFKTFGDGETGAFSSQGCKNDPLITHNASLNCGLQPTVSIQPTATFCIGSMPNIPITSSDPNASFYWINTADMSTGTSLTNPGVFFENYTTTGIYNYLVFATNGCNSDPTPFTVTVTDGITASISQNPTEGCAGMDVSLTANGMGGSGTYNYLWDDAAASTTPSITVNNSTQTTYNVTVSDGSCDNTASIVLSYAPQATVAISGASSICEGETATLTFNLTGMAPWFVIYEDQDGNRADFLASTSPHTITVSPTVSSNYTIVAATDINSCDAVVSGMAVVTVTSMINPSFSFPTDLCRTGAAFTYPTTDDNALGGTWSPPSIDPSTIVGNSASAVFTPTAGCANSYTANMTITDAVIPTFSFPTTFCFGDPVYNLPTTSDNSIAGSWNIPAIDPAGLNSMIPLVFTPASTACTQVFNTTITINQPVDPSFSIVTTMCTSDPNLTLPTTSANGYTGSWDIPVVMPAGSAGTTINLTFTPTADCTNTYSHQIAVTADQLPSFSFDLTYCETDPSFNLPTTSNESYAGTWNIPTINPASISGGNSITSTFSSTDACVSDLPVTINITNELTANFSFATTYCVSDPLFALPTSSDEFYTGSWSIANVNPGIIGAGNSITSVFTPDDDCIAQETVTFNVTAEQQATFNIPNALCVTDAPFSLTGTSDNSFTGTWTVPIINAGMIGAGNSIMTTFMPDADCVAQHTITFTVDAAQDPIFNLPATICVGDGDYTLPLSSDNALAGSWDIPVIDVAANNNQTVNLSWTATDNCTNSYSTAIAVTANQVPVFASLPATFCETDALYNLSTTDDNGIVGSWSSTDIDPSTLSGNQTLTFTPSTSCTDNYTYNFSIEQELTMSFSLPTQLCVSDPIYTLPTMSSEGIACSWSSTDIDPSGMAGQTINLTCSSLDDCVAVFNTSIDIIDEIEPTFNVQTQFCQLDPAITLPTTSTNGISGTWSMPMIDPNSLGTGVTSVFTPDAGSWCVTDLTLNFTITMSVAPTFDIPTSICEQGGMYTFPTTSTNGIMGVWDIPSIDPSSNPTSPIVAVFTPSNNCATPYTATVAIDSELTPSFNIDTQICLTDGAVTLPTTSIEGYVGSWSIPVVDPSVQTTDFVNTFSGDVGSCIKEIQVNFVINESPDVSFDNITTCSGSNIDLDAHAFVQSTIGMANISFHTGSPADASNQIASNSFAATNDQSLIVLAELNGCVQEYPFEITVNDQPDIAPIDNFERCIGETFSLTEITVTEQNGLALVVSYHDNTPADASNEIANPSFTVAADMDIYVLASSNDCSVETLVQLTAVRAPDLSHSDNIEICVGQTIDLSGLAITDNNGVASTWTFHTDAVPDATNEITTSSLMPNSSATIYAYASNQNCTDILAIDYTVLPSPDLSLAGQPTLCLGESIDLASLNIVDLNNSGVIWTYHSGTPASSANELSSTMMTPTADISYYAFADAGICSDELEINISLVSSLNAGADNTTAVCSTQGSISLNDLLANDAELGYWEAVSTVNGFDVSTSELDITIAGIGNFEFQYIVASGNGTCPSDTAHFEVNIIDSPYEGLGRETMHCADVIGIVDIVSLLNGTPDPLATWTQVSGTTTVDLSDPNQVDFSGVDPGVYEIEYRVPTALACNPDHALISIDVATVPLDQLVFTPMAELCAGDLQGGFTVDNNSSATDLEMSLDNGSTWIPLDNQAGLAAADYNIQIRNSDGCTATQMLTIDAGTELTVSDIQYECNDQGTANDPNDDAFDVTITVSSASTSQYEITDGANTYGPFDYNLSNMFNVAADGMAHILTITDLGPAACITTVDLGVLSNCAVDCEITQADVLNPDCDDNGTSNPNDDFYFVELLVNANNGTGNWEVVGNPSISGNYGVAQMIGPYNVADGDFNLEITDASASNCTMIVSVVAPAACSNACGISVINVAQSSCDDLGTTDPLDDTYSVDFEVTNSNNAAIQFELFQDNVSIGLYDYDVLITIPGLSANGVDITFDIVDLVDAACRESLVANEAPCSNACGLAVINVNQSACQDQGTTDPLDDTYDVEFEVSNSSTSSTQFELYQDNSSIGVYDYNTLVMIPGLSANGVDITFDIVDLIDAACTESLVANASSCSSACGISVVNLTIGACADNGTADINTDDIYDINFEVNSDNPSAGQFDLFEDLILVGTYNYNELINVIGLSANGLDLNFTAIDINDPLCTVVFNTKQSPCSSCSETANFVNGDELYLDCQSSSQTVDINLSSMGTYNWTGPDSGDFYSDQLMPQFDLPGQYQLQVTHANGCESNLTLNVIDNATRPEANAGTNKEITCYDEMVTLDGSALGNGNYSYAWYDENGDLVSTLMSPSVSQAGEYSLIITDEDNQCASLPSTVTVTEDKAEPDMDILSNSTFELNCIDELLTLTPDGDLTDYEVKWIVDGVEQIGDEIIIEAAGEIYVEITDMSNGCTQRTMVVITQNIEAPTIQLNAPGTIDCENPTVMINTNGSSNGADFDYQWYNEELTMIFPDDSTGVLISNPGMYFLEIVNTVNGCAKMDSVDVMANLAYPNIDAGNEQIIPCGETTVTLNGQLQNALPNVDVTWYDSDNNLVSKDFEPTVSETGWYYFEAENKDNACMSRDSVLVSLDPNMITDAVVELQSPQCYGEQNGTVRIVEVMSADQGLSYSLNGVLQSDANFGQLGAGNYELIISNVSGCNYIMQFEIEDVDELTLDLSLQDNHEIELGEQVQIEAFTNLTQNEIAMIEWSNASTLSCPDCLAPVATPLANTEYEILITDINGCLISRTVKILVDDELKVYLPNIFSPNQDGKNERFTVYGDRQVEIVRAMQVYNRWGNLVFTAEDFAPGDEEAGWDGKYQDNDVQSGVYVYRLELLLINGETKVVNGDLTIIR